MALFFISSAGKNFFQCVGTWPGGCGLLTVTSAGLLQRLPVQPFAFIVRPIVFEVVECVRQIRLHYLDLRQRQDAAVAPVPFPSAEAEPGPAILGVFLDES